MRHVQIMNRQRLNVNKHDPWHSHSIKWIPNEFQLCHETSLSYRDRENQFCANEFPRFSLQCLGNKRATSVGKYSLENYSAKAKRTSDSKPDRRTAKLEKMTEQQASSTPVSANLIVHCHFFSDFFYCLVLFLSRSKSAINVFQ